MSGTQLPGLEKSTFRNILAAGALAVAGAAAGRALLDLPPRSLLQIVGVAGCGALLLLRGLPQLRPQPVFGAANQVTLLRAVLVAWLVGAIGMTPDVRLATAATVIGSLAALLDGVDGWLARRLRMATPYGARFDMETDALLVLVLSTLVWQLGKAGAWVLVSGCLRYAFVAAGFVWPRLRRPLPHSRRRKTIAALQMILLIAALSPVLPRLVSDVAAAVAVATLMASFYVDLRLLWRDQSADG